MKQNYTYTCPRCKKQYQLSSMVEVVNKFAWEESMGEKERKCISCTKKDELK